MKTTWRPRTAAEWLEFVVILQLAVWLGLAIRG